MVLADWLQGCYTATSFEEALAQRDQLQPGESIYVKSGHVVMLHSVSFYAQDSEQAGLLARAQEIENLEKGGPIALADFSIPNDTSREQFLSRIDQLLLQIDF